MPLKFCVSYLVNVVADTCLEASPYRQYSVLMAVSWSPYCVGMCSDVCLLASPEVHKAAIVEELRPERISKGSMGAYIYRYNDDRIAYTQ